MLPLLQHAAAATLAATTALTAAPDPAPPAKDPVASAVMYPQRLAAFVQRREAAEARREAARARRVAAREARKAEQASPTANQWSVLRACESGGNYRVVSANGLWFGAYQFTLGTWAAYGSAGNPAQASPAEQDRRALALWRSRGWQPWPVCGLRAAAVR